MEEPRIIEHNPLAPKQNNKLPFWKQPITLPLVLWVLLHVVLTVLLFRFMYGDLTTNKGVDPKSTQAYSFIFLMSFSTVTFCLAVIRKLGELTLRPFRRRQQRVRRER